MNGNSELSCSVGVGLGRCSSPPVSGSRFDSRKTADISTEAVFVETMLDNDLDMESPTWDMGTEGHFYNEKFHNGVSHSFTGASPGIEDSLGDVSWDLDTPSAEGKELETVFEDDVLSDSSSHLERSTSNCSIMSDFRDRSGSTWSAMTLCDRERSNSITTAGFRQRSNSTTGLRERSYSTAGAYHESTNYNSGSGYRQRSYSSASDYSLSANPLRQSYRISFFYNNSAFTFLDPKGKLFTGQ